MCVKYFGSLLFEALTSQLTYQFLASIGAREALLKPGRSPIMFSIIVPILP